MVWLDARLGEIWGFSPLIFVRGHFLWNRHSSASFSSKATSCGKVSKILVCRRRKKWVRKKKKKHVQNIRSTVHRTGDLITRPSALQFTISQQKFSHSNTLPCRIKSGKMIAYDCRPICDSTMVLSISNNRFVSLARNMTEGGRSTVARPKPSRLGAAWWLVVLIPVVTWVVKMMDCRYPTDSGSTPV